MLTFLVVTESCGTFSAYLFFNTYVVVVTLIFLNLFIAIIIEGFDNMTEKSKVPFKEKDLEKFTEAWVEYDSDVILVDLFL